MLKHRGEDLEKTIVSAGFTDLVNNLGSILTTQVDDRNILALRNLGKTRSLRLGSDVTLR